MKIEYVEKNDYGEVTKRFKMKFNTLNFGPSLHAFLLQLIHPKDKFFPTVEKPDAPN